MAKEVIMSKEKFQELQERLEYLEKTKRSEITEAIKEARALGDLSENAEYDAAKNEEAQVAAEIAQIKEQLNNATIIDTDQISTKSVAVGCFVQIVEVETRGGKVEEVDEPEEIKLVGTMESDAANGKISNDSPLGRALVGRKKGEVFTVVTPGGKLEYKVLSIRV